MSGISGVNSNNINSAILSGQFGLQNANNGITQAASNIAQQTTNAERDPQAVLANAATQSLQNVRNILPSPQDDVTTNLLSLKINSIKAQASAKVLDVANDTIGTIIDTLA
jgi:ribosome recycling factor